ncbi:hypothetical protein EYV94_09970 [Puteibacter caeruleilacunae]|nr:hypothetical protein EYV94_09970 [Puteibacter caeruleilacunae]
MKEIVITEECLDFIEYQDKRVVTKFFQLIDIMTQEKVVHSNFVKKLHSTKFYELRIKAGNEYRVIMFAIDELSFAECKEVICLYGFKKKSTKDYKKAIASSERILNDYLQNKANHGTSI